MNNSFFNFRDDEEREQFYIAIPVLLFFGLLWYWLSGGGTDRDIALVNTPEPLESAAIQVAEVSSMARTATATTAAPSAQALVASRVSHTAEQLVGPTQGVSVAAAGIAVGGVAIPTAAIATRVSKGDAAAQEAALQSRDIDADSVPDLLDKCPTLVGVAALAGCPADSDNDGIADAEDRCPTEAGAGVDLGCPPDSDRDGIFDSEDLCPQLLGSASNQGCPADQDDDGIYDQDDGCPAVAGEQASGGCPPDSDGDGVIDELDQCPDVVGSAATLGCAVVIADSDGDGVADEADACPATAGMISLGGCPVDDTNAAVDTPAVNTSADSDADGIADSVDQCPDVAGVVAAAGCPVASDSAPLAKLKAADQKILDEAVSQVKFRLGSAILSAESETVLTAVVDLMKRYPQAVLTISGHTDSLGNAEKNLQLSADRARACASYLRDKGVATARLQAFGYGEARPVASNRTPDGRRQNRRVEFGLAK